MSEKTGGSAFPARNFIVPKDLEDKHVHALGETQGMTLRDYFAAKAMQAIVSSPDMFLTTGREGKNLDLEPGEAVARASYDIADSMLAERDK
jgi:hypothetical protein